MRWNKIDTTRLKAGGYIKWKIIMLAGLMMLT